MLGLAGLAVGFLIGYGTGRVSTGTPINPLSDQKGGYQAGYEAAMKKVSDSGILPASPTASTSLQGTVTAVSGTSLTMEADMRLFDPLGLKELPATRVVAVTDATVIVRVAEMTPEELNAAQSAYLRAAEDFQPDPEDPSVVPPVPPSPFKETAISLADLKAGDIVIVTAAADILTAASFEAVRITVAPPPPAEPSGAPIGAPGLPPEETPPNAPDEVPPPPPSDQPAPSAP